MAKTVDVIMAELADREAIRDCLVRISRAIDRADLDLWRECFWPEATDNHAGLFAGKMVDLLEQSIPFLEQLNGTTHFLGNSLIELDGSFAAVETYVMGYHLLKQPDQLNVLGAGRYLDRFERRGDEWRMIARNLVLDWFMNVPTDGEWSRPHFDHTVDGARKPDDFSFQFLGAMAKV